MGPRLLAGFFLLLGLVGCGFSPSIGDGAFQCGDGGACPPGFHCETDDHCHRDEATSDGGKVDLAHPVDMAHVTIVDMAHVKVADMAHAVDMAPACVPQTCGFRNCGTTINGCGGVLTCGSSDCKTVGNGLKCGGGGANLCGFGNCKPTTCMTAGATCSSISDGCSTVLNCGMCMPNQSCVNNKCS